MVEGSSSEVPIVTHDDATLGDTPTPAQDGFIVEEFIKRNANADACAVFEGGLRLGSAWGLNRAFIGAPLPNLPLPLSVGCDHITKLSLTVRGEDNFRQ